MNKLDIITMERLDPLLVSGLHGFDSETLRLHIERYQFALPYVRNRTVVDCACGTGYGSEILAKGGALRVTGVDICQGAIDFARQKHAHCNVEFIQADALAFRPLHSPEVWVTLETVEHLSSPQAYLSAVHDRLPASGLLIASVPTTVSTDGNPYHRFDFTRRSWRGMVLAAGFTIQKELRQSQRFSLSDVFGRHRGPRLQTRRNLLLYYFRHPRVALARLGVTFTKGLVNEYSVVVALRA